MRLRSLDLLAYGPFVGATLDLSARGGLDLVYGPNEAGKSTSLRAIRGLLFGIEERTSDDHLHDKKDLRIGARIEGEGGEVLAVVRRKGRKATLQSFTGETIDDARLDRLLAGVSEQVFATTFGLDHRTLREGADALLAGRGGVGESLLEAGLGARGLSRLLTTLRAEADDIYTSPRAHTKPLVEALRGFKEEKKKSQDDALAVEAWEAQRRGLAETEAESARLEIAQREAQEAAFRARRVQRVLPKMRLFGTLTAERASIGEVPMLAASATSEREAAETARSDARAAIARLDTEIADLAREQAGLVVSDELIEDDAIALVVEERGSHRKAAHDLPKRLGELSHVDDEIARIRVRLGVAGDSVPPSRAVAANVRKLAPIEQMLVAALRSDREALVDAENRRDACRRELAALPPARDLTVVSAAARSAASEGDLLARFARVTAEVERRSAVVARACAKLGIATPLRGVPTAEATAHHERAIADARRGLDEQGRRVRDARARAAAIHEELAALLGEGGVPTERELGESRRARDDAWREALAGGDVARFVRALDESDALADRMRREADRVARLAVLRAREESSRRELAEVDGDERRARSTLEQAMTAWRALWSAPSIEVREPVEMLSFVRDHEAAVSAHDREQEARDERAATARVIERHEQALSAAVGEEGELSLLLERAAATLAENAETESRRRELGRALRDHDDASARLLRQRDERAGELLAHRGAWSEATRPFSTGSAPSPEEALGLLDDLEQLARALEQRAGLDRRIRGIDRDAKEFTVKVAALVARHAPDLVGMAPEDAAAELGRRREHSIEARTARRKTEEQLAERRARRAQQSARLEDAERILGELRRVAGAHDDDQLRSVEERTRRARGLDARIAALAEELVAVGEGRDLDALRAEVSSAEPDAISATLEDREVELRELRDAHRAAVERTGGLRSQLEQMRAERTWAATAASNAQQHLARARELAERWARAKVSVAILEREITRYREQNQGPVLARASELFARLTLGRYAGLRTTFDEADEAVLCALRGETEVTIEGLSDGTRDQLYLALRLASLERHAAKAAPMPVVLDDVLVHFDDARARSALEVLADVGDSMQVLLFTHHERVVELAREALGARVRVHSLG